MSGEREWARCRNKSCSLRHNEGVLKKAIGKIVQDVVYNEDAKPRSVWTDGSPIEVKFAILDEAVDKILSVAYPQPYSSCWVCGGLLS